MPGNISKSFLESEYPRKSVSRIARETGLPRLTISGMLEEYKLKERRSCVKSHDNPYYNVTYPAEFNEALREKIRDRDGRKCMKCFKLESDLRRKCDVHHIDENKYNNNESNLISYCQQCHQKMTNHVRRDDKRL